jgi:5-(carboxyamino)imidazole ribonucleotide synthase
VNSTHPLKKRIGLIGGGQLGRMMIEESLRLNTHFNVLDTADCPCSNLAHNHIIGKLTDGEAIKQLAAISDVLSYEIEHIDVDTLLQLEQQGVEVIPSPRILKVIQDKGIQKEFFAQHQIPTAPFILVHDKKDWEKAITTLGGAKMVAKTRKDGYDGKGVTIFNTESVLSGASDIPFHQPCVLEKFIPCEKEISVMVARDKQGDTKAWPVVEMEFDPIANLVTFLDCPASVSNEIEKAAKQLAIDAIKKLDGIGVFAIEMFLTANGELLVNEIAPRPHNSGHHTIEACYTSQFEQLVRVLLDLPLGSTELIQPAVMMNLLGAEDFSGTYKLKGMEEAMQIQGVYIHLYGKKESKPMRKMGHVTITAPTLDEAKSNAKRVQQLLTFVKD